MAALVTTQQVKHVTGKADVTDDTILIAQGNIDLFAGVDLDDAEQVGRLRARDVKLVLQAICHQAAWLSGQVEPEARMDVAEIAGSTSTGGTKTRDEFTMVLAPLAQACLKRVTWHSPRRTKLRALGRRGASCVPFTWPSDVHVSVDPMDNPGQLTDALIDGGPLWGEPNDKGAP